MDYVNLILRKISLQIMKLDGIPGSQFNIRAAYKTKSGHLLFGTTKGVLSFNPNELYEESI